MTRQATDKILEMVEQGILDKDTVIQIQQLVQGTAYAMYSLQYKN